MAVVVTEGLAESLMVYITDQVTNELVEPLSSKLATSLGATIPPKVEADTPRKLASHVTKSLVHSLTRSVSHSVVPSLVHTLTHSPLQDYYCYYCFHHKTYCQYCQYSPSQLYYALYYTGFYSTWVLVWFFCDETAASILFFYCGLTCPFLSFLFSFFSLAIPTDTTVITTLTHKLHSVIEEKNGEWNVLIYLLILKKRQKRRPP